MYYLYILSCSDGTLYIGITTDVIRRVKEHNSSPRGAKYTKARRPLVLLYQKKYKTRSSASKAEYAYKQLSREQKLLLVEKSLLKKKK